MKSKNVEYATVISAVGLFVLFLGAVCFIVINNIM